MGNKNYAKEISRFHVTELCPDEKLPRYLWIMLSSALVGDKNNVCITAVTVSSVICQKTCELCESPNLSGVEILWADLEGRAENISGCFWSFL